MILYGSGNAMILYKELDVAALIELVRGHDDSAFDELVSRYTPMMNKLVSGFITQAFRYDEAFSEACVALHRAALSYDVSRSADITFGLYAQICVYRRLCDAALAQRRGAEVVDVDVDTISAENNIERRLVGREQMSRFFEKARGVLSEYEYCVFRLYIEGDTTKQIAEKLGKGAKSVENAKARMLRHLREECKEFSDV